MYGPVIQGSRFRLRPPRPDEAEIMTTWFADQEVTARLGLRFPPSIEEEREWLSSRSGDRNSILWAIEHEGRAVGTTGLHFIDWQNRNATTGTLIGDRRAWGKGIGSELMRLRAEYAFTELPLHKLKSAYLEGNEASRRALMRAGYREVGRLRQEHFRQGRWLDHILVELLREEWARARSGQRSGPTGTPT